jgi:hypothetical protein
MIDPSNPGFLLLRMAIVLPVAGIYWLIKRDVREEEKKAWDRGGEKRD